MWFAVLALVLLPLIVLVYFENIYHFYSDELIANLNLFLYYIKYVY